MIIKETLYVYGSNNIELRQTMAVWENKLKLTSMLSFSL